MADINQAIKNFNESVFNKPGEKTVKKLEKEFFAAAAKECAKKQVKKVDEEKEGPGGEGGEPGDPPMDDVPGEMPASQVLEAMFEDNEKKIVQKKQALEELGKIIKVFTNTPGIYLGGETIVLKPIDGQYVASFNGEGLPWPDIGDMNAMPKLLEKMAVTIIDNYNQLAKKLCDVLENQNQIIGHLVEEKSKTGWHPGPMPSPLPPVYISAYDANPAEQVSPSAVISVPSYAVLKTQAEYYRIHGNKYQYKFAKGVLAHLKQSWKGNAEAKLIKWALTHKKKAKTVMIKVKGGDEITLKAFVELEEPWKLGVK